MKKILTTLLHLILATVVLVSCQSTADHKQPDETNGQQTQAPSETDGEKPAESPFKIPETDMRDWVVDYMYKMANVKWTPTRNMDLTKDDDGTPVGKTLTYKKGVIYHGLPYINLMTDTDYEDFISSPDMKWDESKGLYLYDCPPDRSENKAMGNDCSSAILLAYKRFDTGITAYDTGHCFPLGAKTGIYALGDMVVGANDKTTDVIVKNTPEQTHYEALALLQKGDTIIRRTDAGHTRMVLEVEVIRIASGKINGARSTVKTIEQTNTMDSQRKDGVNTNWYVEHVYTFTQLRENNYIPVTCKALSEERVQPEVKVAGANSAKTIATAKSLLGEIRSNYPVLSAEIAIKDAQGNELYSEYVKSHISEISGKFPLKNFRFKFDMSSLAAGDYSYTVTAETVCGKGEVYKVDFSKK